MSQEGLLPPRGHHRVGPTPRQERFLGWLSVALVVGLSGAWLLGLWDAVRAAEKADGGPTPVQTVGAALLDPRSKTTAYLSDSDVDFLDVLRGRSGKLKAAFRTPGETVIDEPAEEASAHYEAADG